MAERKIKWTSLANAERKAILNYWIEKNKSKSFSVKLNKLFVETAKQLVLFPELGRLTDYKNVRVVVVRSYLMFYRFDYSFVTILSIWDNRRDGNKIKYNK